MNGYNILVLIVACVVLGVSIWAFVTRCNTDKFGDNYMKYEDFIQQKGFRSIEVNGKLMKWGFNNKLGIDTFTLITPGALFPEPIYLPEGSINPLINCNSEGCTIDPNFISKDNYYNLINQIKSQSPDKDQLTRPTDYTINNPEWQNERRS